MIIKKIYYINNVTFKAVMFSVFQALDLEIWRRIFIGCELYLNINFGKIKWYWTHLAEVNIVLCIIKYKYNFQLHNCLHRIEYIPRIYCPEHYLLLFFRGIVNGHEPYSCRFSDCIRRLPNVEMKLDFQRKESWNNGFL